MVDNLKSDLINGAYSQLRISGITVIPSATENELALRRLEGMAAEFKARNICTGYNIEDTPDINSPSNIDQSLWYAFECILAWRLLTDFGKGQQPDPTLGNNMRAQTSFLYSVTANPQETDYPSRQPIGSGNSLRWTHGQRFYNNISEAPNTCETNRMVVGDVQDFTEHFDSYLDDSETISSYTIEAETGLTIVSDSLTTPDVDYRIRADGASGTESDQFLRVKIVATTSTGRIETRLINFELETIDIS